MGEEQGGALVYDVPALPSMSAEFGAFVRVQARERCCSEDAVLRELLTAGALAYGY